MIINTFVMIVQLVVAGMQQGLILTGFRKYGGDKLYIFTTKEMEPNVMKTQGDIEALFTSVIVKIIFIDGFDVMNCITQIVRTANEERKIAGEKKYEVVFYLNMTGGTKIMSAAMVLAGYILSENVYYVKSMSKDEKPRPASEDAIVSIPIPKIYPESLNQQKRTILVSLFNEGVLTLNELTKRINANSEAAAKRHVDFLQNTSLIIGERRGRKKFFSLTDSGVLLASIIIE